MKIIIGGIQGSGKGTQSKILATKYGIRHISVGDSIVGYLKSDPEFMLPYTLEKYMAGDLAPSDVVNRVIDRELAESGDSGYVIDGYPRKIEQYWHLKDFIKVDVFFLLDMTEDAVVDRLMSRGRSDDTVDGIRNRITQYLKYTKPILDGLMDLVPSHRIDASRSIDEVASDIDSLIKQRMDYDS